MDHLVRSPVLTSDEERPLRRCSSSLFYFWRFKTRIVTAAHPECSIPPSACIGQFSGAESLGDDAESSGGVGKGNRRPFTRRLSNSLDSYNQTSRRTPRDFVGLNHRR